jgi:hypothetical protein
VNLFLGCVQIALSNRWAILKHTPAATIIAPRRLRLSSTPKMNGTLPILRAFAVPVSLPLLRQRKAGDADTMQSDVAVRLDSAMVDAKSRLAGEK